MITIITLVRTIYSQHVLQSMILLSISCTFHTDELDIKGKMFASTFNKN